jgi:hypothetical protein
MRYTPFGNGLTEFARRQGYPDYETYYRAAIDAGGLEAPKLPPLKNEEAMFKKDAKVTISGTTAGTVVSDSGTTGAWVRRDSDGVKFYLPVDILEAAIDPQLGDVYRDSTGSEWVVLNDHMHPRSELIARSIDDPNKNQYYTNPGMATRQSLNDWIKQYSPVLVRRRGE